MFLKPFFTAVAIGVTLVIGTGICNSGEPAAASPKPDLDALVGKGLAYQIEKYVNGMVDYTTTTCIPAAGRPGAFSLIIISSRPIFDVEAAKKAWLVAVGGAVGKTLHDNATAKVDQVIVSDAALMKERRAFTIDASLLRSLQEPVKSEKIDLDQMYSQMLHGLSAYVIKKASK